MYRETIQAIMTDAGVSGVDARHVEAWLRLSRVTLDGLDKVDLGTEVACAVSCVVAVTKHANDALADSFGLQEGAQWQRPIIPLPKSGAARAPAEDRFGIGFGPAGYGPKLRRTATESAPAPSATSNATTRTRSGQPDTMPTAGASSIC